MINLPMIESASLQQGDLIGQGGFGEVYQGRWQGIDVAIKNLYLKTLPSVLKQEFIEEATIMAKCRYPNIVCLYGVCLEEGHYSIVMEYLSKGSLFEVLSDPTIELPWQRRWQIAHDVGKGVSYLHGENILHRDLKSLNVLLNEQFQAKISDFGQSKIKLHTSSTTTDSSNKMGTVRWRAPELFKRKATPTKASDVYGCGMILWEIASRKLPFADAADEITALSWIKDGEKEDIPADCPPVYGELVKQCFETNPGDRPTALQVVQYLDQHKLTGETPPEQYEEKSWHFDPATNMCVYNKGRV